MRPVVFDYDDPVEFVKDMIAYRKKTERSFSVLRVSKLLRKMSPALVSQIIARKRRITLDRAESLAALCGLKGKEKQYFYHWIERGEGLSTQMDKKPSDSLKERSHQSRRKQAADDLFKDWLNIYVKDAARLSSVKRNRDEIFKVLGGIASHKQIERALKTLMRNGYLRVNERGQLVEEVPLFIAGDGKRNDYVRKFHKKSINIAKDGIDQYSTDERYANALVLPLNKESYQELLELIGEFMEKLKQFSEQHEHDDERLYQLIINLCPTGGSGE